MSTSVAKATRFSTACNAPPSRVRPLRLLGRKLRGRVRHRARQPDSADAAQDIVSGRSAYSSAMRQAVQSGYFSPLPSARSAKATPRRAPKSKSARASRGQPARPRGDAVPPSARALLFRAMRNIHKVARHDDRSQPHHGAGHDKRMAARWFAQIVGLQPGEAGGPFLRRRCASTTRSPFFWRMICFSSSATTPSMSAKSEFIFDSRPGQRRGPALRQRSLERRGRPAQRLERRARSYFRSPDGHLLEMMTVAQDCGEEVCGVSVISRREFLKSFNLQNMCSMAFRFR